MSGFAVDLELLGDLVERMVVCERQFQIVEDDVDARVRRLHVQWRGTAATEQQEAHEQWRAGARQMHDALTVLRSVGATAGENYTAAVTANRAMWSS